MILAFDTSEREITAGVLCGGETIASGSCADCGIVEDLLPLIAHVLEESQVSVDQLTAVAVGIGPGSFTGVRSGLATAAGLAFGWKKSLVGASSLLGILGGGEDLAPGCASVVKRANRREYFGCTFRIGAAEEGVIPIEELGPVEILPAADADQALRRLAKRFPEARQLSGESSAVGIGRIASAVRWNGGSQLQRGEVLEGLYVKQVNARTLLERQQ